MHYLREINFLLIRLFLLTNVTAMAAMNPVWRTTLEDVIAGMTRVIGQTTEGMKEILCFGCMTSSAIVSPILFEFRGVWALLVPLLPDDGLSDLTMEGISSYSSSWLADSCSSIWTT